MWHVCSATVRVECGYKVRDCLVAGAWQADDVQKDGMKTRLTVCTSIECSWEILLHHSQIKESLLSQQLEL